MFTSVTPHPVIPEDGPERSGLARFWHQVGPGSRKRYARARIEAERLAALRHEWQEACRHVGLGLTVYTPSGVTVSVPRVARADFGPPVSFTVALRPGQRAADIRAAAPRLALALGVGGLRVTRRSPGWVDVVVTGPWFEYADGDDGGYRDDGLDDRRRPRTAGRVVPRPVPRRQDDTEPADGQPQEYLAGRAQTGDPRRAELLQLRQPRGVHLRPGDPGVLQLDCVVPHLPPRLAEPPPGRPSIKRGEQAVEMGARRPPRQLAVLRPHLAGEDGVDPLVVTPPPGQQHRVGELLVRNDHQQRLRQVVVDVGVDPEQHVPQRGQRCGGVEREAPRPGHPVAAGQVGVQGGEVEAGEGDVPPLEGSGAGSLLYRP